MDIKEKTFEQILSVLFFGQLQISNVLKIGNIIQERIEHFSGDPFVLPVNDAPPEIPRLILKNENDNIKMELSLKKLNIRVSGDIENKIEISNSITKELIDIIYDEFNWQVNRLGMVSISKVNLENSGIEEIKDKYLSGKKFSENIEQLKLYWLKKYEFVGDEVNFWTKLETPEGAAKQEIKIKLDINLIENNQRELDSRDCHKFYEKVNEKMSDEFDEVLG